MSNARQPRLESLIDHITASHAPVVYGPGRGLWVDESTLANRLADGSISLYPGERPCGRGAFIVTAGAGGLGKRSDIRPKDGREAGPRPSFHCSSFTGFAAAVLDGRGEWFDHRATLVPLESLLEKRLTPYKAAQIRGYGSGDWVQIAADGSTASRKGWNRRSLQAARYLDMVEILERASSLPRVLFFAQSSNFGHKWVWEHHTGILYRRDVPGSKQQQLIRCAADGTKTKGPGGMIYHGQKMDVEVITHDEAQKIVGNRLYAVWGFDPPAGPARPPVPLGYEVTELRG